MAKINLLSIIALTLITFSIISNPITKTNVNKSNLTKVDIVNILNIATPQPTLPPSPLVKVLDNGGYHTFQTFNNCGPASLSMALSYYGINVSQKVLGDDLRPYQIISGDNDDKSVTLSELSQKAKEFGFTTFHRPNGNSEVIKSFIANDMPVVTRTWTTVNEDIGHFRVIKGYDDNKQILIQDDSLQGKNLEYSYEEFNQIWEKFNYEYLVLVPNEKIEIARMILKDNVDEKYSWQIAVDNSYNKLETNPNDISARFNLSVALYHLGKYKEASEEFEKVENQLPFRTLWYQIEPILSYYELGNYDKVFSLTDKILNNGNRAYSEAYVVRGKIYKNRGQIDKARNEFEKAMFYNRNLDVAKELLNSL